MPQCDSPNSLLREDESYRDQWRLYYAERQHVMRRLAQFAAGAVILILLSLLCQDLFNTVLISKRAGVHLGAEFPISVCFWNNSG